MSDSSNATQARTLDLSALESWLWEAACVIRGPVDAPKFKDYILPLIFLKRLSDVFEDEARHLAAEFGSEATALKLVEKDHKLVRFFIPAPARWGEIARRTTGLGEYLTDAVRAVARSAPASWPIRPLGDCAYVQTGVAKGRTLNGGEVIELPYLRVANVQDGRLDLSEMKSIQLRTREVGRFLLHPGDVVLTEGGDFDKLGRGFVWKSEVSPCVHQNHIFAVRADRKQLLPEFLAYQAQSSYGKCCFLTVAHKTTNLACINTTKLKAWPILLPPIGDQHEIAGKLSAVDAKMAGEEKRRAALDALFRSLLHQLMTGQVRVAVLGGEHKADGSMSPSEPGVGLPVEAAS